MRESDSVSPDLVERATRWAVETMEVVLDKLEHRRAYFVAAPGYCIEGHRDDGGRTLCLRCGREVFLRPDGRAPSSPRERRELLISGGLAWVVAHLIAALPGNTVSELVLEGIAVVFLLAGLAASLSGSRALVVIGALGLATATIRDAATARLAVYGGFLALGLAWRLLVLSRRAALAKVDDVIGSGARLCRDAVDRARRARGQETSDGTIPSEPSRRAR